MLRWMLIFGLLSGVGLASFLSFGGGRAGSPQDPTTQEGGSGFPTPRP
jgi:hypothetical protein